ncbi:MAG: Uma2 family endonuclease [Acetobacteraceae bacterium]
MNVALRRRPMTIEGFLDWERRQELRFEFDGFQAVAMTGGTVEHSSIQAHLIRALGNRLEGKPCRPHGSHMKIEVAGRIRYPDAFVICSPHVPGQTVVRDPVVVFEIASGSTSYTDRFPKRNDYAATPSIRRYILLEQTGPAATVFERPDWVGRPIEGTDAGLAMPEIGVELPLAELYQGLDFAAVIDEP